MFCSGATLTKSKKIGIKQIISLCKNHCFSFHRIISDESSAEKTALQKTLPPPQTNAQAPTKVTPERKRMKWFLP
jgi:hypothetical protein